MKSDADSGNGRRPIPNPKARNKIRLIDFERAMTRSKTRDVMVDREWEEMCEMEMGVVASCLKVPWDEVQRMV